MDNIMLCIFSNLEGCCKHTQYLVTKDHEVLHMVICIHSDLLNCTNMHDVIVVIGTVIDLVMHA